MVGGCEEMASKTTKSIVMSKITHFKLIRIKGFMEYETGEVHYIDDVVNKLIDEYKLHHNGAEIYGLGNNKITEIRLSQ